MRACSRREALDAGVVAEERAGPGGSSGGARTWPAARTAALAQRVADQPRGIGEQPLALDVFLVARGGGQLGGELGHEAVGGRPLSDRAPRLRVTFSTYQNVGSPPVSVFLKST